MTASHPLDNPIWSALSTRHAELAIGTSTTKRYPAEVAPFLAVAHAEVAPELSLLDRGESVYVVGVAPKNVRDGLLEPQYPILQMVANDAIAAPEVDLARLTLADTDDMLALTAIAYPFFFRRRTQALGTYFGIRVDGRLVSMAGERMAAPQRTEISAICTHPDFLGRGYAAALTRHVACAIQARGETPFLHVSRENTRAVDLYRRLGFVTRVEIELWRLTAPP